MQGTGRCALRLVTGVLLICLVALRGQGLAQDVEVSVPAAAGGSGSVVAPSGWVELIAPVQQRIDLNLYGFYIGDLKAPVAQVDVPIRATGFLTVTPSYMYYSVSAGGLNELANRPAAFVDNYDEHQFRVDGTFSFAVGKLELSARNMYVRRFRPAPADDANRYRGRIRVAYPLPVNGRIWKPFAAYEAFHDRGNGGWTKDRVWSGVTIPLTKHVFLQPSYMWEATDGTAAVHYVLFGLIVRAR